MLMTVVDMERDSKISRHTWRLWIRQGRLATVRIGRTLRVEEREYRDFVARNRVPARQEADRQLFQEAETP